MVLEGYERLRYNDTFAIQCFVGSRREDRIVNPGEAAPGSLGLAINTTTRRHLIGEYNLSNEFDSSSFRLSIPPPPNETYKNAVKMYIVATYYSRSAETTLATQYSNRYQNLLRHL